MKLDKYTPAEHVANKELKCQQLHYIQETLLKNEEGNLSKYEEFFQKEHDEEIGEGEADLSSNYKEFGEKSKQSQIKKWAEDAVKAIKDNHYVDDYLDGADNEEDVIILVNGVIHIHRVVVKLGTSF
ncbi:hypothetical protein JTB14_007240 [Gonioctena quinquepunctata]|nr:hypothetical protein JTB14_007240 [Gonioctena quinquepunctata]